MNSSIMMLVSANLPVGGYSYSQGLEAAIEYGDIKNARDLEEYLRYNLKYCLAYNDLALINAFYQCNDKKAFEDLTDLVISLRTTIELRNEETQKGKALGKVIKSLWTVEMLPDFFESACQTYLGSYALFSKLKGIDIHISLEGYIFSYVESQVISAIKLMPLGQSCAWQIIDRLFKLKDQIISDALKITSDEIGSGSINLSILSTMHETQYSRLFRS